ncbi:MAG: PQQ-binding-like beta-propeller repeat protein [Hydrogenophilus sp.]|nr:PQQ-binding-like beta-propeller repeat protein [Hydrogenophilus sp.]
MREKGVAQWWWCVVLTLGVTGCSVVERMTLFEMGEGKAAPLPVVSDPVGLHAARLVQVSGGEGRFLTPVAVEEGAVVAGGGGEVLLVGRDGAVRWRVEVGERIAAGVGGNERLVAVVTEGGTVVAINVSDGSVRWRTRAGLLSVTPPLVTEGAVLVRGVDHRLVAFEALDGRERWRYQRPLPPLGLRQSAPMTAVGGKVFVGYPGGVVTALDARVGQPVWELTVAPPRGTTEIERLTDVVGPVAVGRSELCATAFQGRTACFRLPDGEVLVQVPFGSRVGVERREGMLVVVDERDRVVGVDLFSRGEAWVNERLQGRGLTRAVAGGSWVLVGDKEGFVHALGLTDGTIGGSIRVSTERVIAPPVRMPGGGWIVQSVDGIVSWVQVGGKRERARGVEE